MDLWRKMISSNLKISLPSLVSPKRRCADGKKMELSNVSKQMEVTEGMYTNQNRLLLNRKKSFMQGSLLESKPAILNTRFNTLQNSFQIMRSLQTSDLVSISKERDCRPYWNNSSTEISKRLWLPIKTDCVDLDSTFSSSSLRNTEPFLQSLKETSSKNLFQNSLMTSWQSLQSSQPDTMANEVTYARKIRIYPTKEQVELFNRCAGANRFFYNAANSFIKEEYQKAYHKRIEELNKLVHCAHTFKDKKTKEICNCNSPKTEGSFFCQEHQNSKLGVDMSFFNRSNIRDAVVPSENNLTEELMWQKEIPYDTRQFAIDQCMAAYSSCFALKRNGHISKFEVHYKTKKSVNQMFQVNKRAINFDDLVIFKKRVKSSFRVRKRDYEEIQKGTDCNVTIIKTKPNKWYICIPRKKQLPPPEPAAYDTVFLDPGERSFMTFYSPDGVAGKLGDRFSTDYIQPIFDKVDKFESLRATCKRIQTRKNIRRRLYKLRDKAKNRVNDLQWKTCNYLCNSFQTIFLPEFQVSQMVEKTEKRVISSKTVRKLLGLSHCEFRYRLQYYAKTKHRNVVICGESYTTKTCGTCGAINEVGGSKIYKCGCGYEMDRDYHGARNIAIRALSLL